MPESSSGRPVRSSGPRTWRGVRLPPLLWSVWGLSLLWTAAAAMPWWGVFFEERWIPALTLQSLAKMGCWGVDSLRQFNAVSSPLPVLFGRAVIALLPSAPLALWVLGLTGVALASLGALEARWSRSAPASILAGAWTVALWSTHPLVLAALGLEWPLALGLLAAGVALLETRWHLPGWLVIGLATLGRPELAAGAAAVALWHLRHRTGRRPYLGLALALTPAAIWMIVSRAVFGSVWSSTWTASRSTLDVSVQAALAADLLRSHPVWLVPLGLLAATGMIVLHRGPALAWAGAATGAACLLIGAALALPITAWWWHLLGPLFGLAVLAATGLAWLLDGARPLWVRWPAAALGITALLAQWAGTWQFIDANRQRETDLAWADIGAWLRTYAPGDCLVLSTQPASLLWHLGVTHRLSAQRVEGIAGPLASDRRSRDSAALVRDPQSDFLVARLPEDEELVDVMRENAPRPWLPIYWTGLRSGGLVGMVVRYDASGEVHTR